MHANKMSFSRRYDSWLFRRVSCVGTVYIVYYYSIQTLIHIYVRFLRALQTDSFNTWTCIYGGLGLMSYIKLLILYVGALRVIVLIISKNFFFNPELGAFFSFCEILSCTIIYFPFRHAGRRAYDFYIELYNNIIKSIIVCFEYLTYVRHNRGRKCYEIYFDLFSAFVWDIHYYYVITVIT